MSLGPPDQSAAPVNQFGRKPGRGLRAWILAPKLLAAAVFFGSLTAVNFIWLGRTAWLGDEITGTRAAITLADVLFHRLVTPSLFATELLGVALFFQHPWIFLRMRWWQVKMISLVLLMPGLWLVTHERLRVVTSSLDSADVNLTAARQVSWLLAAMLAAALWLIVLSRLKPRLGQNWGRAYPRDPSPACSP